MKREHRTFNIEHRTSKGPSPCPLSPRRLCDPVYRERGRSGRTHTVFVAFFVAVGGVGALVWGGFWGGGGGGAGAGGDKSFRLFFCAGVGAACTGGGWRK